MGPTGTPTEIAGERDRAAGRRRPGQRGAVLHRPGVPRAPARRCSISPATRRSIDRYKVDEIEAAADAVVWCCDEAPGFAPDAPQDSAFVGNIVAGDGRATRRAPRRRSRSARRRRPGHRHRLRPHDGGGRRARATACSRRTSSRATSRIGSINSPMQCMMKEICAQCLQPHRDPATGKTSYVFSCFNQDQPLDRVDFPALAAAPGAEHRCRRSWLRNGSGTVAPHLPRRARRS